MIGVSNPPFGISLERGNTARRTDDGDPGRSTLSTRTHNLNYASVVVAIEEEESGTPASTIPARSALFYTSRY